MQLLLYKGAGVIITGTSLQHSAFRQIGEGTRKCKRTELSGIASLNFKQQTEDLLCDAGNTTRLVFASYLYTLQLNYIHDQLQQYSVRVYSLSVTDTFTATHICIQVIITGE